MKNKFLLLLAGIIASASLFGVGHSAWAMTNAQDTSSAIDANFPTWNFLEDTDFAKTSYVRSSSNLTLTKETTITQGSYEAIRMTSTTGSSSGNHIIHINFDRDYYLSEIRFYKIEFDYYHKYKREQNTKGFPSVTFMNNNSSQGTEQGGTDTVNDISPFVVTNIDQDWWHLEYFVFASMPTLANHQDNPIALDKKVNGVKINDKYMFDYNSITAFTIIDNLQFSIEPAARLGIFNRWTSDSAGKFFWFKVAFSGELHSCILSSSDTEVAVPEFSADDTTSTSAPFPNGSPFYFKLLKAGTVSLTATLVIGRHHTVFTVTNTLKVN